MLKEVTAGEFESLAYNGVVLVDFFSSTCGPCKMLSFVLADIDKTIGDKAIIIKIDFDKNKELAEKYEVKGYPTLILLKDGEERQRMSGLQQKPVIIRMIEENQ